MRSMRYRIELDDADGEGYILYNAKTAWNSMPCSENLERPSIRVKNVPECNGEIIQDFASCVSLGDIGEDDDLEFRANYLRALRGELPNWVLGAVQISRIGITLAFFRRNFYDCFGMEFLHVNWVPYLKVLFEVDRENGGVDTYLVMMSADEKDPSKRHYLSVTEHDAYGERDIIFATNAAGRSTTPDDNWPCAYVTEYR